MDANFTGESVTKINSREARARWRDLLDAIWRGSPGIVIERYGKPVAALVSYEAFEQLQQKGALRVEEPTAVYTPTPPPTGNLMNNETHQPLNDLLQSLSAEAQDLVAGFARLLQQQTAETAVSTTPTVSLPAASLNSLSQLLPDGYAGDALADSEALYDDA